MLLLATCLGWPGFAAAQTADGNQTEDTTTNEQTDDALPTDGSSSTSTQDAPDAPIAEETLLATEDELEAREQAKAEAAKAATLAEFENLIIGGWGRISDRGASQINDASLIGGAVACRRARRITRAEFLDGAEQTLPQDEKRKGNIVYYKTGKGLQRLDTAVRKVFLIKTIERRTVSAGRTVWRLSGERGAITVGFGTLRRNGRKLNVLIEQNAVFMRCPTSS